MAENHCPNKLHLRISLSCGLQDECNKVTLLYTGVKKTKTMSICFEFQNLVQKYSFIDTVDLNTEQSGLNLTETKAGALGKILQATIYSFSSLKVMVIVVLHSQSFLRYADLSPSSNLEMSLVLVI